MEVAGFKEITITTGDKRGNDRWDWVSPIIGIPGLKSSRTPSGSIRLLRVRNNPSEIHFLLMDSRGYLCYQPPCSISDSEQKNSAIAFSPLLKEQKTPFSIFSAKTSPSSNTASSATGRLHPRASFESISLYSVCLILAHRN